MAGEKKLVHKVQMTEGKRNIIHQLLEEYDIQTAEDIQNALKDLPGGIIRVLPQIVDWQNRPLAAFTLTQSIILSVTMV